MSLLSLEYSMGFYAALACIAFLYASVGHGGASGYLALMVLFVFPVQALKINALVLNCFVSIIAFGFFTKVEKIDLKLFISLIITSIPASFLGGYLDINETYFKILLGIVLIFSLIYINGFLKTKDVNEQKINTPIALGLGFVIGFISGMIGIGGGIMLTPVLLILGWVTVIEAASVSALFIFVNSFAGICGFMAKGNTFELVSLEMVPFAVVGGMLGAFLGSKYFSNKVLKFIITVIILMASVKLIAP